MTRETTEWHEIKYDEHAVKTLAVVYGAVFILGIILVLIDFLPAITLAVWPLAFLIALLIVFYITGRAFPNMIGLSNDRIVLRFRKKETRELPWTEIQRCIFPDKRKAQWRLLTDDGEVLSLRISDELANRILAHWNRAKRNGSSEEVRSLYYRGAE